MARRRTVNFLRCSYVENIVKPRNFAETMAQIELWGACREAELAHWPDGRAPSGGSRVPVPLAGLSPEANKMAGRIAQHIAGFKKSWAD